jgi:hypothetical protein
MRRADAQRRFDLLPQRLVALDRAEIAGPNELRRHRPGAPQTVRRAPRVRQPCRNDTDDHGRYDDNYDGTDLPPRAAAV